jgi:hypothetical protein
MKKFFLILVFASISIFSFCQKASTDTPKKEVPLAWGPALSVTLSTLGFTKSNDFVTFTIPGGDVISGYPDVGWLEESDLKSQSFHFGIFLELSVSDNVSFGIEPTYGKYSYTSDAGTMEVSPIELPIYVRVNFVKQQPIIPWARAGLVPVIGSNPVFKFNNQVVVTKVDTGNPDNEQLVEVEYNPETTNQSRVLLGAGIDFRINQKIDLSVIYSKTFKIVPSLSNELVKSNTSFNTLGLRVVLRKDRQ